MNSDSSRNNDYDAIIRELAEYQKTEAFDAVQAALKRLAILWKSWGCDDGTINIVRDWFYAKRIDLLEKVRAIDFSLTEDDVIEETEKEKLWRIQQEATRRGKRLMDAIKRISTEM